MDDRKRQIGELERQKKEQAALLDSLLARLGETFCGRIAGAPPENIAAFGELADYRRLQDDIAASQASILSVEEQMRRFKELEEGIDAREREESAFIQEMASMHSSLGKLLLDACAGGEAAGAEYAEFCAPWREQVEALLSKIESLEERLVTLEQKEGGNVFTWIGNGAQSLVLRTFLTKAHENLDQLRRNVGERYSRGTGRVPGDDAQAGQYGEAAEIERLYTEIGQKREELLALSHDLGTLREEKKNLSGSFSVDGSPHKQIQNLKKHIAHIRDELHILYRRVGTDAAAINSAADNEPAERREIFNAYLHAEDQETLDSAARINGSIHDAGVRIEKLRASLAIDDEKAKIEKLHKMIQDKKNKITQAEKNITEFEADIRDSEATIEKLRELL